MPVLALVDLYGSQPVSTAGASTAGASTSAAGAATPCASYVSSSSSAISLLSVQYPGAKQRLAGLHYVHKGLYDERPGMQLLQVR